MCGAQLGRIDGLAFALVESNLNGLSAGGGSAGGGFAGGTGISRRQHTVCWGWGCQVSWIIKNPEVVFAIMANGQAIGFKCLGYISLYN